MSEETASEPRAQGKYPTPPYIAYKTFQTLLSDFKTHGLPPQIDRSVMTRFSGGVQGQLMIALKALGLIDDKAIPTARLNALVSSYDSPEYAQQIKSIVEGTYPYVLNIDLASATPSMFAKAFSEATGAGEESLRKCRAFFLAAARDAGIGIGSRIEKAKFPRRGVGTVRKAKKPNGNGAPDGVGDLPPPPPPPAPISEKALEYRLVDLMSEAVGDADVMTAIIKVITFLKTKESTSTKTATDQ